MDAPGPTSARLVDGLDFVQVLALAVAVEKLGGELTFTVEEARALLQGKGNRVEISADGLSVRAWNEADSSTMVVSDAPRDD